MFERWHGLLLALGLALLVDARRGERAKYLTAYACEGGQLHLSCGEGLLIHLIRANYGRFSIGICNEHGALDWSVDCTSHKSYYVIYERCNLMSSCIVSATSDTFADPCPGTYKYLEVQYKCMLESMTTTSSTSTTTTTSMPTTTTTRPPIIIPLTRSNRPTVPSTLSPISSSSILTSTSTDIVITEQSTQSSFQYLSTEVVTASPHTQLPTTSSTKSFFKQLPEITTRDSLYDKGAHCPPVEFRNLSWDWTKAGTIAVQKCPGGTLGEARWQCGTNPVMWVPESPDLGACSSLWVENLRARVESGDSVVNIAAELSVITHRKPLYGGDVRHAIEILHRLVEKMAEKMQEVADDKQRHQLLQELLESAADVTNNLLDVSLSWEDLPVSDRRHIASTLLEALEHSSWLLASAQRSTFLFHKTHRNILFSVRVMEAWAATEVRFPLKEDIDDSYWETYEDSIKLPTQALLNSATNGVVKMVFAAYKRVKDFLGTVASSRRGILHNSSHIINSRVISASTGRYPAVKFIEPVIVTFKLIQEENVTNPQCVYWDLDTRLWSQEGCWLQNWNRSHAVCACDHLTNFALLMELRHSPQNTENKLLLRAVILTSCALAMLFIFLTVILLQVFRSFPNDHSSIHKHLCICLLLTEAATIAASEHMGGDIFCTLLAGTLHLLLQVVFVWLFLAAFQLYLLLLEPAHRGRSRLRCYSFMAYGISAIIVCISAIVDPRSYGTPEYCFLRHDNYYIFSFVGPAVSCVLGAVMFLGLTICRTCWFSADTSAKNKELVKANSAKIHSRETWFVVLSTGGCWTFLLLYLIQKAAVLAYLFATLNCLQGLAVFICFGLRNDEVRQAYLKWQESGRHAHAKSRERQPAQFMLPTTSSQHSVGTPCVQTPTTVSSLSTVTTPELEFQLGSAPHTIAHLFNHPELCHTRSPIYCHRELLVS